MGSLCCSGLVWLCAFYDRDYCVFAITVDDGSEICWSDDLIGCRWTSAHGWDLIFEILILSLFFFVTLWIELPMSMFWCYKVCQPLIYIFIVISNLCNVCLMTSFPILSEVFLWIENKSNISDHHNQINKFIYNVDKNTHRLPIYKKLMIQTKLNFKPFTMQILTYFQYKNTKHNTIAQSSRQYSTIFDPKKNVHKSGVKILTVRPHITQCHRYWFPISN